MTPFNSQINTLFPRKETFFDFEGSSRSFDIFLRAISADDYVLVAQDEDEEDCTFEIYMNSDPQGTLSLLKREIVRVICAPLCQADIAESREVLDSDITVFDDMLTDGFSHNL